MMILDELAAETRKRIAVLRENGYYGRIRDEMKRFRPRDDDLFYKNLARPGLSLICELKKASPSKGVISEEFPYERIAAEYEKGGAAAISCLTEPTKFLGDIGYLKIVAEEVSVPVLRKDFIVDVCQIEEAALAGASAILLIAAILTDAEMKSFYRFARDLGLGVLCEAHDEAEIERIAETGARIIGVNNRDLRDFSVKPETTERLAKRIPKGSILVSESGMTSPAVVKRMKEAGADAVLIGEMLMRAENRIALLAELTKL